jgi:hypothetical protein
MPISFDRVICTRLANHEVGLALEKNIREVRHLAVMVLRDATISADDIS